MQVTNTKTFTTANTLISTALLSASVAIPLFAITICIGISSFMSQMMASVESAGYPIPVIQSAIEQGLQQQPVVDVAGHKNILLLGLDSLDSRPGSPPLTDTIILASLNTKSNQISLVSFPRDLWSDPLQIKINGLYAEATQQDLEPTAYITSEIERLSGVPVHHTVVVTLDTVSELIDSVGGVQITVTQPFTDSRFPRTDVDVTKETDPSVLYETIRFEEGIQTLDGTRALQYVRSRHSEGTTGTDSARQQRQQQVLSALVQKLFSVQTITNPETITQVASLYNQQFESSVPISELVAVSKAALEVSKPPQMSSGTIPIYPEDPNGVIVHPPEWQYNGQWVYAVRDLTALQNSLQEMLGYEK